MVSFKTSSLRLLQVAALVSTAAARCRPCSPSDKLLKLMRAQDSGMLEPFCAGFLAAPASTVEVTVTPTALASVTSTVVVTEVSTFFEEIITVTEPATVTAAIPTYYRKAKRSVGYPEWLQTTYSPERVSSACQCLSIAPSSAATVTITGTAEAVTVTEGAVVTETTTSTLTTIGVITVTVTTTERPSQASTSTSTSSAAPSPSSIAKRAMVQVLRKSTGAGVGWLYMSSGPGITTDPTLAAVVGFSISSDTTTASKVRISVQGYSPYALGFDGVISRELQGFYGSLIADEPTPPGSTPVIKGSNAYETDIWTVDTATNMLGWEWVGNDGAITTSATMLLYRIGGRAYPVGNFDSFNAATGGASSSKYEIQLKLVYF
ncbi:hypothetical protein QBC44DRAFT_387912 [Cladorrhinum sp. PSN332]|nr:hypothetical protein QBC44DRAFT_387912 [Cladorrhinum sp. PSN332]